MKKTVVVLAMLIVTGCTTVTVKPIDSSVHKITKVCILENPEVSVDNIVSVIEDGFKRHNIATESYSLKLPDTCLYTLTYQANRNWDMVMYMNYAELRVKKDNLTIATATYENSGGLTFTKYASTESKLNPVMDELLQQYP